MTDPHLRSGDLLELRRHAHVARERARGARRLAADRRRRAVDALRARQPMYAQGLLDGACWLEGTAEAEERRAREADELAARLVRAVA